MLNRIPPALFQTICYAVGLFITKGVSLIMIPIVTEHLAPEQYGILEVLITLADIGGVLLGMGLVDTLFRFAGTCDTQDEKKRTVANIFGMAIAIGVIATIVTQLSARWLTSTLPGDVDILQVRTILIGLSFTSTILVPLAWMRMQEEALTFLIASTLKALLQAGCIAAALYSGYGVTGIIVANTAIDCLFALWLAWRQWRHTGISLQFSQCQKYLVYGGPLVLSSLATFVLGNLDRWVVADAVGTAKMAEYALAAKFGLITVLLLQPFDMWWFPKRFSLISTPELRETNSRYASFGIALAITTATGVALLGPTLVRMLTPETYHGAVGYIPWFAALMALQSIGNFVNIGCYSRRTGALPMVVNGTSATVALISYMVFIPEYGVAGALIARFVAQTTRFLMFFFISQRVIYIAFPYVKLILTAAVGSALVVCSSMALNHINEWLYAIIAFAVLAALQFQLSLVPMPSKEPKTT